MTLEAEIEAILFWRSEPMSLKKLAQILGKNEGEISDALVCLEASLAGRGLVLLRKSDEVTLGTAPGASALIEQLTKEELARDLGKAGLETLAIILYRGPISRAQIDYIRGVNSSFILRHLQIRDLVIRIPNPEDARSFLYQPTFNLLQYLGVSRIEDLPDYQTIVGQLNQLMTATENHDH